MVLNAGSVQYKTRSGNLRFLLIQCQIVRLIWFFNWFVSKPWFFFNVVCALCSPCRCAHTNVTTYIQGVLSDQRHFSAHRFSTDFFMGQCFSCRKSKARFRGKRTTSDEVLLKLERYLIDCLSWSNLGAPQSQAS